VIFSKKYTSLLIVAFVVFSHGHAQTFMEKHKLLDSISTSISFRSIGPAFMSGRVADIAVHPHNSNIWYVAHGSGGVWKTENSGTTWKAVFEQQNVYATGCLAIDQNNPHTIWLGTGENVGGRHIGFGDGIYRSTDDGKTWKNFGLSNSEHISKIIIHPKNSQIIWVACQGPLWSPGGDRGLFKSVDGGKTWVNKWKSNSWTGATDLLIDPRNPKVLYMASWQRHRTIAAYMGGGEGSGIYRSDDGGESWKAIKVGLPNSRIGKIGLAISPQNPDVLYAALELDRRTGAVFRSNNRGENWKKMSNTVSGGTGPHYYQELYASPHQFDKIYLANVRMLVSDNGGKTFYPMNERFKHSDNHALIFNEHRPNYRLVGTDGGLYQSFDGEKTWSFVSNLPTLQYYKVAVDDKWPFYTIYGGTQDNNTHGGPARTDNIHGIRNSDWFVPLSGDGHQPAVEPSNPNIVYAQWQQGNLTRIDRSSGESTYIQPQNLEDGIPERYNWDAPVLISSHHSNRIYFASQHLWKSDNRGDSWIRISPDLTRNVERFNEPIMGKKQSFDNAWDVYAMSNFSTITSIAESPLDDQKLAVGTDDGLLQFTKNGGETWEKKALREIQIIPPNCYVNDLKADLFDKHTFYVALDNHKEGDYKPYLLKTTDDGKTWSSLSENLPKKLLIWRIVQDHINKDLLFIGTEFGIYASIDGGKNWSKLTQGIPTIPIRDLAIQRKQNDLVAASFGRGFFVLDDYSVLREVGSKMIEDKVYLGRPRNGLWYIPKKVMSFSVKGGQGDGFYHAKNPPYGVTFNYYVQDPIVSLKQKRKAKEKKFNHQDISFPGWESLEKEHREQKSEYVLHISEEKGKTIRKIPLKSSLQGLHQTTWDMKHPSLSLIDESTTGNPSGFLASPGRYCAQIFLSAKDTIEKIGDSVCFQLIRINKSHLSQKSIDIAVSEWRQVENINKEINLLYHKFEELSDLLDAIFQAFKSSSIHNVEIYQEMKVARTKLDSIEIELFGYKVKNSVGEKNNYSLRDRITVVNRGIMNSTYGLTEMQKKCLNIAQEILDETNHRLNLLMDLHVGPILKKLESSGAPGIKNQVWLKY